MRPHPTHLRTWRRAAAVAACALLAAPAAAHAASTPTLSGTPEVGDALVCSVPPVSGHTYNFAWTWDTAGGSLVGGSPVGSTAGATPASTASYTPTLADLGHALVCTVTDSDGTGTVTQASSAATAAITPVPAITLTQYSPTISGNIGESVAGVQVTVTLSRGVFASGGGFAINPSPVAALTATTDGGGNWSGTLTAVNPATGVRTFGANDVLSVRYARPSNTTVAVPLPFTYYGTGASLTAREFPPVAWPTGFSVAGDGSKVTGPDPGTGCAADQAIVDNAGFSMSAAPGGGCVYAPSSGVALTDANHVQAAVTTGYADPVASGSPPVSTLTTVADVGLVGVSTGAPYCNADLVTLVVVCGNLGSGSFTISRNGLTAIPLSLTASPNGIGVAAKATLPLLAPGDVLTLDETSPARTTRHLATLHVGTLRFDVVTGGQDNGNCVPDAVLYDNAPDICSAAGTMSMLDNGHLGPWTELDDLSGGLTSVSLPSLSNFLPSQQGTVPASGFTAYADLNGTGVGLSTVNLKIIPHGSVTPVFNQNMALMSDSETRYEQVTVPVLAVGRFHANWLVTDINGDTVATYEIFATEPGTPGPVGPIGPIGATGPQGVVGPVGATGKTGVTGSTGLAGPTGPSGPVGATGKGATGATGIAGPEGPAGAVGPRGLTGPAGPVGPAGPRGPKGERGPAGPLGACLKWTIVTIAGKFGPVQELACTKIKTAQQTTVKVKVTKGTRLYAVGSARIVHGRLGRLLLRRVRRMTRARYTVTITLHDARGTSVTSFPRVMS